MKSFPGSFLFPLLFTSLGAPISPTLSPVNVLIFGPRGYLGEYFKNAYPEAKTSDADIGDVVAVSSALDREKPDVVINCAGRTGRPNVDWCEDHKEETVYANVTGPLVLLHACLSRGIYLVHLSSGCIYAGDHGGRGFSEGDPPNFSGSFYSKTKAWSDQVLKEFPVLILRMRMPFDGTLAERNLLSKLRKYPRVLDEENSITYLPDFVDAAKALVSRKAVGIYHLVNEGVISPYRLMELYKEIVDPAHTFQRLTLAQLGEVTKTGRSNCMLSGAKAASEGVFMRPAEEAARLAMENIKKELATAKK